MIAPVIRAAAVSGVRKLNYDSVSQASRRRAELSNPDLTHPRQERDHVSLDLEAGHEQGGVKSLTEKVLPDVSHAVQEMGAAEALRVQVEELEKRLEQLSAQNGVLEEALRTTQEELERERSVTESLGFQAGFEAGKEAGQAVLADDRASLNSLLKTLEENVGRALIDTETLAIEIGFASFLRLVGELSGSYVFSKSLIAKAVSQIREEFRLNIHVSEKDYDLLQQNFGDLKEALSGREIRLIADRRVVLGGCMIETERGGWDARLETQLERLKAVLVNSDRPF